MDPLSDDELAKAESPTYSSRPVVDDWCRRLAAEVRLLRRQSVKADFTRAVERSSLGHVPMDQYTRLLSGFTTILHTLEEVPAYGTLPKPFRDVVYSVLDAGRKLLGQA